MSYRYPQISDEPKAAANTAYLVASGDLRLSANQTCWAAQEAMEADLVRAFGELGWRVIRAHDYDPAEKHGFISSQKMGIDVFRNIPPDAPLIVAEAVWQYSHHVLPGLRDHRGPILCATNWSATWPGLVGQLNLVGGLTKMNKPHSVIWGEEFTNDWVRGKLREWVTTGAIRHDLSHVRDLDLTQLSDDERKLGTLLARKLKRDKAILGVFDEGCMGMYNAIIDDEMVNPCGLYKERLSQSALVAEMQHVHEGEAKEAYDWLLRNGMKFVLGTDEATELTEHQVLEQLKMYIAAVRIADDFGCAAIGIQYQQGLKDMAPASDLAEGLLNNVHRPPVRSRDGARILFENEALPHFNEVDEGAAVDALVTNRVWCAMELDPATTLHDIRWGEEFNGQYVWVFLISGAAPPSHFIGGYQGTSSERQPAMYFRLGGGTVKGISKPGEIVWSRVFVMDGALHADMGLATVVELPAEETERRWQLSTPQWPIMHAVLHGVTRDQMMARHKANHIQVAYAPEPDKALAAKAAMFAEMGIKVHLCGV